MTKEEMNELILKIESAENQDKVVHFLDEMLNDYNSSVINKNDGRQFTLIIRDENEDITGGISGWTWATVSEITLLWIKEEFRNRGFGKMLLNAAEDEIIRKGCSMILLRTYTFQAPIFYEKNGYKIEHTLENFPPGYKHYTLVKKIKPY